MERATSQKMVCRKDMQCTCPMCLASLQATWDLRRPLPSGNAFHTVTNREDKFSNFYITPPPPRANKGKENTSPNRVSKDETICTPVTIPFAPLIPSHHLSSSPKVLLSSERHRQTSAGIKCSKWKPKWVRNTMLVTFLSIVFMLLPKVMLEFYPPSLTGRRVGDIVEESLRRTRLSDRFDLIQRRFSQALSHQTAVSNCTGGMAAWSLKEGGRFLYSECAFFSSPAESATVWGSPVKSSGLLGRGGRDRSLAVISGRVFEWREGEAEYRIHEEGGRWTHSQWAASVVLLERNTWIVEYKRSVVSSLGSGSFSGFFWFVWHQVGIRLSNWKAAFDATVEFSSNVRQRTASQAVPT